MVETEWGKVGGPSDGMYIFFNGGGCSEGPSELKVSTGKRKGILEKGVIVGGATGIIKWLLGADSGLSVSLVL